MVIFDFDLTLVDTGPVEALRAARKWGAVMARAPGLEVYEGVHELLSDLHARNQTLAIVTKSPDMVPKAFVERHGWPIDIVVGYHQVRRRKPDPEALLLAMRRAGADPPENVPCRGPAGGHGGGAGCQCYGDRRGMGTRRHRTSRGIATGRPIHVRWGIAEVLPVCCLTVRAGSSVVRIAHIRLRRTDGFHAK